MSAELVETNENDLIVGTLRANQNILIVLLSLSVTFKLTSCSSAPAPFMRLSV